MKTRRQHFVVFRSPGTFFDEESLRPIESWDVKKACEMAGEIEERYESHPYGFFFTTAIVADPIEDGEGGKLEVNPRCIAQSGMYMLDGRLRTIDDIAAEAKQDEEILLSNMRANDWPVVVETQSPWRHTTAFHEADCIVNSKTGEIIERGDSKRWKDYRKAKIEEHRREMAELSGGREAKRRNEFDRTM